MWRMSGEGAKWKQSPGNREGDWGWYRKEKEGDGFGKYEGRQEELMVNYKWGGWQGRGKGEKYIAS